MRPEEHDRAYLWDKLEAAEVVQDFILGKTPKDYMSNRMLRNAVERNIEIIGEAARHVSGALQQAHPEIPWRSIIGQRNILIHEYGEVRHEFIWNVVTKGIPELIAALRPLLTIDEEKK